MSESNQAPTGNLPSSGGRRKRRRGSDPFVYTDGNLAGLVFDAPGAIASGIREAGKGVRGLAERVTGSGDDDNAGGFGNVLDAPASIASAAGELLASAGGVAGEILSGAVDAAGPVAEAVGEAAGEAVGEILGNLGDVLN